LHRILNLILILVCASLVIALAVTQSGISQVLASSVRVNAGRANELFMATGRRLHMRWSRYNAEFVPVGTKDQVRAIYAVLTTYEKAELRNAIRTSYRQMMAADPAKHSRDIAKVVFVIGKSDSEAFDARVSIHTFHSRFSLTENLQRELLKYESDQYNDILMLNMTENMNDGKTFE
jgi:hypothetical protein